MTTHEIIEHEMHPPIVGQLNVLEVKSQVKAMHDLFKDVMKEGDHWGTISGTPKPTLYKAGAEKIGLMLRLAPSFERQIMMDEDHMTVISECTLRHAPTGMIVSSAGAVCSTKETKYAYRQATASCPECGQPSIIQGKAEYGGGWLCYAKKGGCGKKWSENPVKGPLEREENPNLADTYNTVLKMADKRSYVAATLFGTAASDIYTQDVEDFKDMTPPAPLAARPEPDQPFHPTPGRGIVQEQADNQKEVNNHMEDEVRANAPTILEWYMDMATKSRADGNYDLFWKAKSEEIQAKCKGRQWSAIMKRHEAIVAKDLAASSGVVTTAGVQVPSGAPLLSPTGADLLASMEKSPSRGQWWENNKAAVDALPIADIEMISNVSDQMDAADET